MSVVKNVPHYWQVSIIIIIFLVILKLQHSSRLVYEAMFQD